jgi:hypothetical protein
VVMGGGVAVRVRHKKTVARFRHTEYHGRAMAVPL